MKTYIFFLLPLLLIACSGQKEPSIPDHLNDLENLTVYHLPENPDSVLLEAEQTYGDTHEVLVGYFSDVTVDDRGKVYIADGHQTNIKVYEPNGELLTQLGRDGEGPGEFSRLNNLQISGESLLAFDNFLDRIVVFDLNSLEHDRTINLADNRGDFEELNEVSVFSYHARNNYPFLIRALRSDITQEMNNWETYQDNSLYYLIDENGDIISGKLFEQQTNVGILVPWPPPNPIMSMGMNVEFFGKALRAQSNDGPFYWAWSDDFLVKVYSPEGEYQRAFYYPYDKASLTQESASDTGVNEYYVNNMPSMNLPDTWPAMNDMLIDDEQRLWISTIVDDMEITQWWVLSDQGILLGRFSWPRNNEIEIVKNGQVYALETDEETGIEQVVRYSMEITEN